jgi:hypothetical protein
MDIRAQLKNEGWTEEEIGDFVKNQKALAAIEKFSQKAEQGETAFLKAQQIQQDLKTWNDTTVTPYVTAADQKVAAANAKLAAVTTHLKSLKDAGYDIPDSYLESSPAAPPAATPPPAARGNSDELLNYAKANMALISMSERARDLLGHGLDVENEYEDFGKNKRPGENLRGYITRKYDLETLAAKRETEKKQKYEDGIRQEAAKKAVEEYQQKHGSNPDTILPAASKVDRIVRDRGDKLATWQTAEGRAASSQARLDKYKNAKFLQ